MAADLLVKGDFFIRQLREMHGSGRGEFTRDQKLAAAKKVEARHLKSNPLFWAMSNLANYTHVVREDGPQKLPLSEIVAVAAGVIHKQNDRERAALLGAQVFGMMDDFAALSCIFNGLDCCGFRPFIYDQEHDAALDMYNPRLRSDAGGYYANCLKGWTDVFGANSELFIAEELPHAGRLLREFSKTPLPRVSERDPAAYWRQAEILRLQLDKFWEEVSDRRVGVLTEANPQLSADIDILADVTVLQQGYLDGTRLAVIRRNIATLEKEDAGRPAKEERTRGAKGAEAPYIPLPDVPAPSRDRTREVELSKRQDRINKRAAREEAARVAAGADPTPAATEPPPPKHIQVNDKTLEAIAWFWPHESRAMGSGLKLTWGNCVSALAAAGMANTNIRGNHYTFKSDLYGSMTYPAPHSGVDTKMDSMHMIWLGRECTKELRWTWDTFDPDFEAGDDEGADAGDGGDEGGSAGGGSDVGDGGV